MSPDEELMLIFGALHLVALALGVVLFVMFVRSDSTSAWRPPEDDDAGGGGGGNDRVGTPPKRPPNGGIPLPDADPSDVRLRDHGDALVRPGAPRPSRTRAPEPERSPRRIPSRH
jgi:hypothetical protein